MNVQKKIYFIICMSLLVSCSASKENYYSYKINNYYLIENLKTIYSSSSLISYGNYLFEFRNRLNISETIKGEVKKSSQFYDTLGVYLMTTNKKVYYEFDKFSKNGKLIKNGNLEEKPTGVKFSFKSADTTASNFIYSFPRKEIINNIDCFTTEVVPTLKTKQDSIIHKMILIKNPKFNSLFKVNGMNFTDKNFCIVGFTYFNKNTNQTFAQEIEAILPLTESQKKVCEQLVSQINL